MRGEIPKGETLWREELAGERTVLSWVRTGLNAIGFGILLHAIAHVSGILLPPGHHQTSGLSAVGLAVVALGAFIELAALAHFLRFRRNIREGYFTDSSALYLLVALGVLLFGTAFIAYIAFV